VASNDDIMEILVKLTEGQTEIKGSLHSVNTRLKKIELVQEDIKEIVEVLEEVTGKHEIKIKVLERRPV